MTTTTTARSTSASRGGSAVGLTDLHRHYGPVRALDGLTIELSPGELVALLGPSGCGKTTALRIVAGLEQATSGSVRIAGTDVSGTPTNKRDIGMVFQAYSLFPHMTARRNVEFGMRMRGKANPKRAGEMLELVGLSTESDRYPHQMSGGQQQRVALARALAVEPAVLLLDEPLSALDAKVRVQLRDEIRRIQLDLGTTTLFVTHDQEEALAIADRVGVMRAGQLEQLDTPTDLYLKPASGFVADFVGTVNRIGAQVHDGRALMLGTEAPILPGSITSGPGVALVRPEHLTLVAADDGNGRVILSTFLGATGRTRVILGTGETVNALVPSHLVEQLSPGTHVRVTLRDAALLVVPTP
ncbi:MAG: ABC transporter ATP-binding protein [Dermatophilaceae bacterium]